MAFENISWDAMIPSVSGAQFNPRITGITIRKDRKGMVDFPAPYMRSEMVMLVRGNKARMRAKPEQR
ncbi:MAG: transporter substrate-binding domain-containing protein [Rhodobacteraceae bacterium]|nr:transporter substrate-binding domain-containing protein [Paracoccaceae bacterium]